jgi:hypothetical protein
VRKLSRKIKSDIALSQRRAGMRRGPFWGEVRETKARDGTPKPGAHIVAPMPSGRARDRLVAGINSSSAYGDTFAEPCHDRERLKSYCLKEMAPEAAYRTGIRRMKGSHVLPEGGDRVRVSPAVREALIRSGRIEPFTRSYSKTVEHEAWQFDAEGQGVLFDWLPGAEAPDPHQREPVERPKIEPAPMLRLFAVVGNIDEARNDERARCHAPRNWATPRPLEGADDEYPERAIQAQPRRRSARPRASASSLNGAPIADEKSHPESSRR